MQPLRLRSIVFVMCNTSGVAGWPTSGDLKHVLLIAGFLDACATVACATSTEEQQAELAEEGLACLLVVGSTAIYLSLQGVPAPCCRGKRTKVAVWTMDMSKDTMVEQWITQLCCSVSASAICMAPRTASPESLLVLDAAIHFHIALRGFVQQQANFCQSLATNTMVPPTSAWHRHAIMTSSLI